MNKQRLTGLAGLACTRSHLPRTELVIRWWVWYNCEMNNSKPGLYANINAKRERIEAGSKERMRKPGSKGAPTAAAFKASAKTAKKK